MSMFSPSPNFLEIYRLSRSNSSNAFENDLIRALAPDSSASRCGRRVYISNAEVQGYAWIYVLYQ